MAAFDGNVMCVALAGLQASLHSINIQIGQGLVDPDQLSIAITGMKQTLSQMPDNALRNEYTRKITPMLAEMERMATITWASKRNG